MLRSLNFAVISCEECGEIIKIEPGRPFEPLVHVCKSKEGAVPVERVVQRRDRKPKSE